MSEPQPSPAEPQLTIENGMLMDASSPSREVVLRGLCYGFAWCRYAWTDSPSDLEAFKNDMQAIHENGANAVRFHLGAMKRQVGGLTTTQTTAGQVKNIILACEERNMIAILNVWDCSSYPSANGSQPLSEATKYWTQDAIKKAIVGHEDKVIINIANEPWDGANGQPGPGQDAWSQWYAPHQQAIREIRAAGLRHVLMVDGPTVGGDGDFMNHAIKWGSEAMEDPTYPQMRFWGAEGLRSHDPDGNIMFDIHVYQDVRSPDTSPAEYFRQYFDSYRERGLAIAVGEFSSGVTMPDGSVANLDETAAGIIEAANCSDRRIGFLGWAWNSGPPYLFQNNGQRTDWGELILGAINRDRNRSSL